MQFAEIRIPRGVRRGVVRFDTIMNEYLRGNFSVTNLVEKMREKILR